MKTDNSPTTIPRSTTSPAEPIDRSADLPKPKLLLRIDDLRHPGATTFTVLITHLATAVDQALTAIVRGLYTPPRPTTLFLRDIDGVAYTTGTDSDKEIHFSLSYIQNTTKLANPKAEILGVLLHELVHCYQHTAPKGRGSVPNPPGGLIEGIADFIEDVRIGQGAIGMLNDRLLRVGYVGEQNLVLEAEISGGDDGITAAPSFWRDLFGVGVQELWNEYGRYLDHLPKMADFDSTGDWEDELVDFPK
ncbi:peptidase of plants and bacteria-domain-containing protein [Aspergillus avenaceus]|uniref:Peptidase of plants and bacteria-domain-containing protein n=1 Tax=Aspergillus avenaceus TaxID=36643 RepID=A0A5N6TRG7_ASPAV|nr:peptidase of plants and bacteria-domain-containing protein [Aspergillus avenaceus]